MSKAKRPFSGATKAAHKRKFARLPNDPIEMELWRLDSKAATSTATTTDAESRLQNYKKSQGWQNRRDVSRVVASPTR